MRQCLKLRTHAGNLPAEPFIVITVGLVASVLRPRSQRLTSANATFSLIAAYGRRRPFSTQSRPFPFMSSRPSPTPVLDQGRQDHRPAAMLDRSPRVEIVLSAGRRVIAEGGVDIDVMLKLARGLEALG